MSRTIGSSSSSDATPNRHALGNVGCLLSRVTITTGLRDHIVREIESTVRAAPVPSLVWSFAAYEAANDPQEIWLHEVQASDGPGDESLMSVALAACADACVGEPSILRLEPVRETAPGGNTAGPVVPMRGGAEKVAMWCRLAASHSPDDLLSALEPLMEAFDNKSGTEIFTLYVSRDDPTAVWMHEVYTDQAAFVDHGRARAGVLDRDRVEAALAEALATKPDNTYVQARFQILKDGAGSDRIDVVTPN